MWWNAVCWACSSRIQNFSLWYTSHVWKHAAIIWEEKRTPCSSMERLICSKAGSAIKLNCFRKKRASDSLLECWLTLIGTPTSAEFFLTEWKLPHFSQIRHNQNPFLESSVRNLLNNQTCGLWALCQWQE